MKHRADAAVFEEFGIASPGPTAVYATNLPAPKRPIPGPTRRALLTPLCVRSSSPRQAELRNPLSLSEYRRPQVVEKPGTAKGHQAEEGERQYEGGAAGQKK